MADDPQDAGNQPQKRIGYARLEVLHDRSHQWGYTMPRGLPYPAATVG